MTEPIPDCPTADRGDVKAVIRERMPDASDDEVAAFLARIDRAARHEARYRARPRDGRVVHHLDGNPYNNHPDNLRVVDPREGGQR